MQSPHHLPPNIIRLGKRLLAQYHRVGRVRLDAHEAFVGQKPLPAKALQRRQQVQHAEVFADLLFAEADRFGLALGGEDVDDDRQQVFQGGADRWRIVESVFGKLAQVAERFAVQGLEPIAEMEGARFFPVRQKAQKVRREPHKRPVGTGYTDFGRISVQRHRFLGMWKACEESIA